MGGKIVTKEEAIQAKKKAFKKVNQLLEQYINSGNSKSYKKAKNISAWLSTWSAYIDFESKFQPAKNIAYKRGDVIKVNLGFNVGSEHGGIHYGVVLDKVNRHNSNTITIIPLSSFKKSCYERDVFLGDDLFKQINAKWKALTTSAQEEYAKFKNLYDLVSAVDEAAATSDSSDSPPDQLEKVINELDKQRVLLEDRLNLLYKMEAEIKQMKQGSIAKIEQITTISKMRIIDPKKSADVLSQIRLSPDSMNKINEKVKELFIF